MAVSSGCASAAPPGSALSGWLASVANLVGLEWQAGAQVLALGDVRNLAESEISNPTREHREEFAAEFDERVGPTVRAVDAAAVERSDIVHTATSALSPVFDAELLEPGTHIIYLRVHEVGTATVERADHIA